MAQYLSALLATAFLIVVLVLFSTPSSAAVLTGEVVSIQDGDTLTILDSAKAQHRVRLAQVDAPEIAHRPRAPSQPYGYESKQSLASMTFRHAVTATCGNPDKYGRLICNIRVGDLDVNREQVKRGMAMVYDHYVTDKTLYADQEMAKRIRLGIWQENNPTPPWNWRKDSKH